MIRIISFVLLTIMISSCTPSGKKEAKTPVKKENNLGLPALPQSEMTRMFNSVTYIDYIFYDLPFSISQDNQASIQANLQLISSKQLLYLDPSCKPIGREFIQIDGDIIYEADLYFSEGCYGYVFIKDKEPIYANQISEGGMNFYSNIIKQASGVQNKMQNGQ